MKRKVVRKLGLISLGCPKNTVDSERLLGELELRGWEFTADMHEADCLVVNTCGFIGDARLESEEAILEISEAREANPDVILVATGCLPQRLPGDLKKFFPQLDLVVGIGSIGKLPDLIENLLSGEEPSPEILRTLDAPGRALLSKTDDPRLRLTSPWTAYMKIAEGCGHACAFCTIPYIKGPHFSRTVEDLVSEASVLAADGVREIILVSQDTTAYGSDIGTNLRVLLSELDKVEGVEWIRLHYLYPSKVSPGLIDTIAESRRILPYFDIPLQHVSIKILSSMDRLAPDTDFLDLIGKIRAGFESSDRPACIRTTLMVGFPGETDEDVAMMHEFLDRARVDRLTVFQFSAEKGTAAFDLSDRIPDHESELRMNGLMEAQHDISLEINEEWVGRKIDVLLEGESDDGRRVGRSYRDAPEIDGLVFVSGIPKTTENGEIIQATVVGALPYDLEAEIAEDR